MLGAWTTFEPLLRAQLLDAPAEEPPRVGVGAPAFARVVGLVVGPERGGAFARTAEPLPPTFVGIRGRGGGTRRLFGSRGGIFALASDRGAGVFRARFGALRVVGGGGFMLVGWVFWTLTDAPMLKGFAPAWTRPAERATPRIAPPRSQVARAMVRSCERPEGREEGSRPPRNKGAGLPLMLLSTNV
jgi:hypothetical protein